MTHRKVDLLTREVDVVQRCRNAKINVGVRLGEMAEPMDEPFRGEIRRRA
jgi:hypothetical protein